MRKFRALKQLLSTLLPNKNIETYPFNVDIHAHWLPGVDDGAKNPEEGLQIIMGLKELGFTTLIATPHIMHDNYDNTPTKLREVFTSFKEYVQHKGVQINLQLAAEYMLDDGFMDHLHSGDLLTFGKKMILVEMSYAQETAKLKEILFEIQLKGYKPILAHPERYNYYHRNLKYYKSLKDLGCYFQLNMLSLVNAYGKKTTEIAKKLIQKGWYEFAGTDIHNPQQLQYMKNVTLRQKYNNEKLVKSNFT